MVSFSPAPYMRPLTDSDLASFVGRESAEGRRPAWLVLRRRDADAAEWRALYGPLIADLATGRMAAHPWFHLVAELDDALVFRVGP